MKFVIDGEPQGKARARTVRCGGTVHSFTPKKTVLYEKRVQVACISSKQENFCQVDKIPLRMIINAYFSIPKSYSKEKRQNAIKNIIRPTKKPDADNIAKIICDALNGIAYVDDSQIVEIIVSKVFDEFPRVEVEIYEV